MFRRERALHGMRSANAAIESPGAQRASPDAHQAHRVVAAAHFPGVLPDSFDHLGLKRQMRKTIEPCIALPLEGFQGSERLRLRTVDFGTAEPVGRAYH